MKAIPFILLCFVMPNIVEAQNGQTESEIITVRSLDNTPMVIAGVDPPPYGSGEIHWVVNHDGNKYRLQFNPTNWKPDSDCISMSDILQYENECNSDSITLYLPVQCDDPACLIYHGYEYKTIHVAPSFEGFISWLKKRKQ